IDEPQCDRVGAARLDRAGLRLEHVDTLDPDPDLIWADRLDLDVGLAEHDEQVAGAGILQFAGHMQVGVMRAFRIGMPPMRSSSAECASKLNAQAMTTSNPASAASTRSARCTVPNSGPTRIAARRSPAPSV